MRAAIIALAGLLVAGCTDGPTLRVVVESSLAVPAALDEVTIEIAGRTATARLTDPGMLPASVELRATGDGRGPYDLVVVGRHAGAEVARVTRSVSFPDQGTATVTIQLDPSCADVICGPGQRCEAGACVPDLEDGGIGDAGLDGGAPFDACLPTEACNARDDDCDGEIDEAGCEPCVREAGGGHVYLACDEAMAWDAARARCAGRGYDLVIVDGTAENDRLVLAPLSGEPWIGLRRVAGELVWVDGSALGFAPWQGAEPNPSRDCTLIRGNGTWRTEDCAAAHPFVCEVAP